MIKLKNRTPRLGALLALLSSAVVFAAAPAPAVAAPVLQIDSDSQSTIPVTVHAEVETLSQGSSSPARNEVQRLTVAAAGGTYRLSFGGDTTDDVGVLPHAPAVPGEEGCYCSSETATYYSRHDLQEKLEALPAIGSGNVLVNGGGPPSPYGTRPFRIEFTGALGATDAEQLTVEDGSQPLAPGITYLVQVVNTGPDPTDGTPIQLNITLPPGLTGVYADSFFNFEGVLECPSVAGKSTVACSTPPLTLPPLEKGGGNRILSFTAAVDPSATGELTATFSASGGGAETVTTADPVTISPTPAGFGVEALDAPVLQAGGADFTQAGGHPDSAAGNIDFNVGEPEAGIASFPGPFPVPAEHPKDAIVDLPPGLLGNPAAAPRCSLADLAEGSGIYSTPLCSPESQVATLRLSFFGYPALSAVPVFSLTPAPGHPARFGFALLGTVVVLDATVRNGADYGVSIGSINIPEGLSLFRTQFKFWGDPASPVHDGERACPGFRPPALYAPVCGSSAPDAPFLRYPTSCEGPLNTHLSTDSWFHPGDFVAKTFTSHTGTGYPWPEDQWGPPQGPKGCEKVRFNPSVTASPTTNVADSPSGLDFHLAVSQDCWDHVEEICQSDLKGAEVTLPQGMVLNPGAAAGLGVCSEEQIGYKAATSAPFEFTGEPAHCPDNSKIGTVKIDTPLLARFDNQGKPLHDPSGGVVPDPLRGSVYLAKQGDNPFGSLFAMYIVAEGQGIVVKQAGEILTGPGGRLTTRFEDTPQTPFSDLEVNLLGGPRAPLRTPPSCGSFGVTAKLAPWSGTGTVTRGSTFEIENCPNSGFDPKLSAGTQNPLAGSTSPFSLRLTREDGTQEIGALSATLPEGLLGYLKGIAYCPDSVLAAISADPGTGAAQEASPSCPVSSRIGTVSVGAGAGPNPFYTTSGRAYLAGPYKGSPVSIAVVAPAVAGPFDLGTVVVRNAIRVDPTTSQLTVVSDPLPSILYGIPLDIRDVLVRVDRDHFTLNPTSCDEMQIASTVTSTQGVAAHPSQRFQAAGCDRLGFKPKLTLALKGPVHRRAHPSLRATYTARPGDANLARAQVKLPPAAFLDNAHIGAVCTRVEFAAQACPADSVYGHAQATSPILDYPVAGNVYLRSSEHELPDLVADLRGPDIQPIEVALAGRTDAVKGALRNTFELVPDAPVTKFTLQLFGNAKGLIQMSSGFCAHPRATVKLDGHNGRVSDSTPKVRAKCGGKSSKAKKPRRAAN